MDKIEEIEEVEEMNENSPGSAGELLEILLNTREQGQMIEQLIKNQINIKDEMISKLHKELDYYKQDSAERFADQLMKAVIKVRKDMGRLLNSSKWSVRPYRLPLPCGTRPRHWASRHRRQDGSGFPPSHSS